MPFPAIFATLSRYTAKSAVTTLLPDMIRSAKVAFDGTLVWNGFMCIATP